MCRTIHAMDSTPPHLVHRLHIVLGQFFFFGSAMMLGGYLAFVWVYPALLPASAQPSNLPAERMLQAAPLAAASGTGYPRTIETLTIEAAVPPTGKFIAADLSEMKLYLYQDGAITAEYPILTKGRPGSPYETPSGFYAVLTKERNHLNRGEGVHMPYSMQFYGNYFIHGWPYYVDGRPVSRDYSGGCIRLSTEDAADVFQFADPKTPLFVYEATPASTTESLQLGRSPAPQVSAASYLVADLDTGDVYLEREAAARRPIVSLPKLMTALVASETIMYDRHISISDTAIIDENAPGSTEHFRVGDVLYLLLMKQSDAVAERLAAYYGSAQFVRSMNSTAPSLNMNDTHFADPSGMSQENISTTEDLYRLARYIDNKKSFIFNISRTPEKKLVAADGTTFTLANSNAFAGAEEFMGGGMGAAEAAETALSVFAHPDGENTRRIAIIVLESQGATDDTKKLLEWFSASALAGEGAIQSACVSCTLPAEYRKIKP